jgi:hypothetical protein
MDRIISMGIFFPRPGRAKPGEIAFLKPVDDLPPATMIHRIIPDSSGDRLRVLGSACDDYEIRRVLVNGVEARPLLDNFASWEAEVPRADTLTATGEDVAGNLEKTPHVLRTAPNVNRAVVHVTE